MRQDFVILDSVIIVAGSLHTHSQLYIRIYVWSFEVPQCLVNTAVLTALGGSSHCGFVITCDVGYSKEFSLQPATIALRYWC